MTLRFLQTTPSASPGFPFQPGQVITVDRPTPEMRQWLKAGFAEVVKEEPEIEVTAHQERAVLPRGRPRVT